MGNGQRIDVFGKIQNNYVVAHPDKDEVIGSNPIEGSTLQSIF